MEEKVTTYKAGYQNKADSMRELGQRSVGKMSGGKDVIYSASCADKEKPRKYKSGGSVKKYAMGGVAKIRHDEATPQGLPKNFKKKSFKECL